jgi:hypothetical protein
MVRHAHLSLLEVDYAITDALSPGRAGGGVR